MLGASVVVTGGIDRAPNTTSVALGTCTWTHTTRTTLAAALGEKFHSICKDTMSRNFNKECPQTENAET